MIINLCVRTFWPWNINNLYLHGSTITITTFVFSIAILFFKNVPWAYLFSRKANLIEYFIEYINIFTREQIRKVESRRWVSVLGSIFIFIFFANWIRALLPLDFITKLELTAPTNDINVTTALALFTSHTYFYAGLNAMQLYYFTKYLKPSVLLLPINLLEDISKPLSLSFRLFRNILADELTLSVLYSLVPCLLEIPIILLRLFTSRIQALVFTTLLRAYIREALEARFL